MTRQIFGIITGYAIFVVSSLVFFRLTRLDPHSQVSTNFTILTAIYGAVFSSIGGFVTQLITKTRTLMQNYILAFIIAGFATFSLVRSAGSHWTQILAITIFAPVSILGGVFYINRRRKLPS